MFIATIVRKEGLDSAAIAAAADLVKGRAGALREGVAVDIAFDNDPAPARRALEALPNTDVIVQREVERNRQLLVADMDSTMITVECIDELADYAGCKADVAAITERAMQGELDFAGALAARVALLTGLREATMQECLRERVRLMPGGRALVAAFRRAGGRAVLVSGGFTHFAGPVGAMLGFDRVVANRLVVADGRLTGRTEQPIVDAQTKREVLLAERGARSASVTLAIGDGANDIPMIEAAGLGIAFRAKPKTEAAADARIRHGDLSVVRHALALAQP